MVDSLVCVVGSNSCFNASSFLSLFLARSPCFALLCCGMVCRPRLVLLCVGVLAHVVRCFLHCPAAEVVYSRRRHTRRSLGGRQHVSLVNAASRQPVPQDLFIAVLRDVQLERAEEVARALYKGGFRTMSITTNTRDFETILRHVAGQDFPGLTVGASSVCSVQQVRISRPAEDYYLHTTGRQIQHQIHVHTWAGGKGVFEIFHRAHGRCMYGSKHTTRYCTVHQSRDFFHLFYR